MRFFLTLFLLLYIINAHASTIIEGIIHTKSSGTLVSIELDKTFPKTNYYVDDLTTTRLRKPLILGSSKIDDDLYNMIVTKLNLQLISYNKETGQYKFLLSCNANKLYHASIITSYNDIPINSKCFFTDKMLTSVFIEGKVKFADNRPIFYDKYGQEMHRDKYLKPVLDSKTDTGEYFAISRPDPNNNSLMITALRDIPVTLYVE